MKLFDVYPLFDINIVKGKGCHVWDDQGTEYPVSYTHLRYFSGTGSFLPHLLRW